jgi:GGDEF domain-containing protein
MDRSAESLTQAITEAAALVAVSAALRALEEYNRGAAGYLHAGGNDLRAMVKMLTTAIGEFSFAGDENIKHLRDIETQVASAQQSQDVRAIKSHLANCLKEIRKETERQRAATQSAVGRLQADLERARTDSIDPATGLPPRSKAVQVIAQTCAANTPAVAGCFVVDHLQSVNAKFGSEVGDQILHYVATHIQRGLPNGDRLFRWTGACLVAISPRQSGLPGARKDYSKIADQKLEYSFQTPTRNAAVPIHMRWNAFEFTERPEALAEQIDAFASLKPV